jgi:hypothetical protein
MSRDSACHNEELVSCLDKMSLRDFCTKMTLFESTELTSCVKKAIPKCLMDNCAPFGQRLIMCIDVEMARVS